MRLFIKYLLMVSAITLTSTSFAQQIPGVGGNIKNKCKPGEIQRRHGTEITCMAPNIPDGQCLNEASKKNHCDNGSEHNRWFSFPQCVCIFFPPPIVDSPNPEPEPGPGPGPGFGN